MIRHGFDRVDRSSSRPSEGWGRSAGGGGSGLTRDRTATIIVPEVAKSSSRFVVGVHVLTLLAHEEGRALTSDYIAGSVNTNPVVIRRVLRSLARAGLVRSSEGAGGGTTLARSAERISLVEVFQAVEHGGLFGVPRKDPNPLCPVGRCVQSILGGHLGRFQKAMEREMKEVTVADILAEVRSAGKR